MITILVPAHPLPLFNKPRRKSPRGFRWRRNGVVIALALLNCTALASGGMGASLDIKSIRHLPSGDTIVRLVGEHDNPDGCSAADQFVVRASEAHKAQVLTAALMAKATRTSVNGWVSGCVTIGSQDYARIVTLHWQG
ncbi:MAG: hypothetical protein ACI8PT_000811 [Gammaproteobacteria bacterium]|jgi:hypothetical protein